MHTNRKERLVSRLGRGGADGAWATGDSFGSGRCRSPGDDGGQGCT